MTPIDGRSSEPRSVSSGDTSLLRQVLRPRTLISFAIGIAILVAVLSTLKIDVADTLRVIRSARWELMLAALVVYYTVFPVRALRWRGMLENTGIARSDLPSVPVLAEIIYLSWFANSVVPAKLGDVYRAYLLRTRAAISFSKAGGTIVAERLIDLAVLLVALGVTGVLSFRGVLPGAIVTVLEIGSIGLVAAGIGLLALRRWDEAVIRRVPYRFQTIYRNFHAGTLDSFGGYPQLGGLSLLAWSAEVGRLLLVTWSVSVFLSPDPLANVLMVAFVALGAAFLTAPPGTPAGLGYVEASMASAIVLLGSAQHLTYSVALSVALLDRAISYVSLVVGGLVVYVLSQRHGLRSAADREPA